MSRDMGYTREDRVNAPSPALQQTTQDGNVLLPSLVGISDVEHKTQAINRRVELEGTMPFANSRLRAYTGRIDALTGGMASDMSSMQPGAGPLSVPTLTQGSSRPGTLDPLNPTRMLLTGGGHSEYATIRTPNEPPAPVYGAAMEELNQIRSEMVRVEATLSALKAPEERSTMGRVLKKKPPRNPKATDVALFQSQKAKWEAKLMATMEPVSRGEAVILDQALEEMLPVGQLVATLEQHKVFDARVFESEFELVDMVQKEAARQVKSTCLERGVLLEKVRARYGEFFGVLAAFTHRLQQKHVEEMALSQELRNRLDAKSKEAERLGGEAMQFKSDNDFLRDRLEGLEGEFSEYKAAAEEALVQLHSDNALLEHEVNHYQDKLSAAEGERAAAVSAAMAALDEELSTITEERDDLVQRIRFLERQIAKLREERARPVAVDHASVQTDPLAADDDEEEEGEGEAAPEEAAEEDAEAEVEDEGKKKKKKGRGKKRPKRSLHLGGFAPLLAIDKVGRVKPKGLILRTICQIYTEKIEADRADDLANVPRTTLPVYTYDWHLNRYGLRTLAEINLLDLVASVRHYQKESIKIRLFAQFCGLQNKGDADRNGLDSLNFYLGALQVLTPEAGAVSSLFPETEDGVYWMRPMDLLPVLRAVFRNLEDPQAMRDFMSARVEPLMDPKRKMYDADALQLVLQDEFERRSERRAAQLTALFRTAPTGGSDQTGVLTFDAFEEVLRKAAPEESDSHQLHVRMYREALQLTGDGESIAPETFVHVCNMHGIGNLSPVKRPANLYQVYRQGGVDPNQYDGVALPSPPMSGRSGGRSARSGGARSARSGGARSARSGGARSARGGRPKAAAAVEEEEEERRVVPDELFDEEELDDEAVTQFAMLDSALAGEVPLKEQLELLRGKVGESSTFAHVSKENDKFWAAYRERQDWREAWAQYRLVVGELRTALVTYHGGLQDIEPPKPDAAAMAIPVLPIRGGGAGAGAGGGAEGGGEGGEGGAGSAASTPLTTPGQRRSAGGGPEPEQQPEEEVSALNMLKGTSGNISEDR